MSSGPTEREADHQVNDGHGEPSLSLRRYEVDSWGGHVGAPAVHEATTTPTSLRSPSCPGGFKRSGYGTDLSPYGLEDYIRIKRLMLNIEG
jgi:hypothetical protein